jgi:hypothetical protein
VKQTKPRRSDDNADQLHGTANFSFAPYRSLSRSASAAEPEVGMKRKRTEITIETERMLFISSPRKVLSWCAVCDVQVEMVPVDEAAILQRVDSRTIFRWVETERVHSSETANGLLLICLNSLA